MPTIPARLRSRREQLGWSKAEVARRAGIARPYYSRIEDGLTKGSIDTFRAIGDALGMTFGEVFGVHEPAPRDDDIERCIDERGELDVDPPARWLSLSVRAAAASPDNGVRAGDVLLFEGEDTPSDGDIVLAKHGRTWRVGRYQAEPLPLLHPWSPDGATVVLDERWAVMAVAVRQWRDLRQR